MIREGQLEWLARGRTRLVLILQNQRRHTQESRKKDQKMPVEAARAQRSQIRAGIAKPEVDAHRKARKGTREGWSEWLAHEGSRSVSDRKTRGGCTWRSRKKDQRRLVRAGHVGGNQKGLACEQSENRRSAFCIQICAKESGSWREKKIRSVQLNLLVRGAAAGSATGSVSGRMLDLTGSGWRRRTRHNASWGHVQHTETCQIWVSGSGAMRRMRF